MLALLVTLLPATAHAEEDAGGDPGQSVESGEVAHEVVEEDADYSVESEEFAPVMDTGPDLEVLEMTYEEEREHYLFLERMAVLQVVGLGVIGGSILALAALRFWHAR